jgi:hypothetical protein
MADEDQQQAPAAAEPSDEQAKAKGGSKAKARRTTTVIEQIDALRDTLAAASRQTGKRLGTAQNLDDVLRNARTSLAEHPIGKEKVRR